MTMCSRGLWVPENCERAHGGRRQPPTTNPEKGALHVRHHSELGFRRVLDRF